jgi:hypothetical protein
MALRAGEQKGLFSLSAITTSLARVTKSGIAEMGTGGSGPRVGARKILNQNRC